MQPGTINYVEGQAAIGSQTLAESAVGSARLRPGQTLITANGRVEVLLTPGVFLRIDHDSSVRMVSAGLADTVVALDKGEALVDAAAIRPANNVRVNVGDAGAELLKPGLYEFDASGPKIRVFDGKAAVQAAGKSTDVGRGHEIAFQSGDKMKDQWFNEKQAAGDDFYRWSSLRSSYLADANVDAARAYAGQEPGWNPGYWYGEGWYWDPWYDAYTFLPGDGIFFDPFGWGFYSPWFAPYFGFGGWGGYGWGGGHPYRHTFGPGYQPPAYVANAGAAGVAGRSGVVGHATAVRGASAAAMSRGGGFAGASGARGGAFGGARGGFGGGGFHGGGGGGHGR